MVCRLAARAERTRPFSVLFLRHHYEAEKRHALEQLAASVDRILDPKPNVVAFAARA
jgi:hypothetical protein